MTSTETKMAEAIPALIECAEILAAQCRVSGDEAHARMYQARAEAGRALKTATTGMLHALRIIVEYGPQSGMKADAPMLIAARAALAKATGQ